MVLRERIGGGGGGRIDGGDYGCRRTHVGRGVLRRRRSRRLLDVKGHGEIGTAGAGCGAAVGVGELRGRGWHRHAWEAKRRRIPIGSIAWICSSSREKETEKVRFSEQQESKRKEFQKSDLDVPFFVSYFALLR